MRSGRLRSGCVPLPDEAQSVSPSRMGESPMPRNPTGESPVPLEPHGLAARATFGVLDKRRLRGNVRGIMTLTEIIEEIPRLSLGEQLKLADALAATEALAADNALWDEQIRKDIETGGPLYQLGEEALEELRRGECLPGFP